MKEIKLTQGKVAIVDDSDYEKLNQFKWYAHWNGGCWYAVRTEWNKGNPKQIYIHRMIMFAPENKQIDHINSNTLDNRKENLRLCTHQENQRNRVVNKNNILKTKGVGWCANRKRFRSQIQINKRQKFLGYFTVLADADQAYRVAEIKYFGEFAREETKKLYQVA